MVVYGLICDGIYNRFNALRFFKFVVYFVFMINYFFFFIVVFLNLYGREREILSVVNF